jgi:lipoyl(octanoyl) transferase
MKKTVELYDIGLQPYHNVWELQKSVQKELITQKLQIRDGNFSGNRKNDWFIFVEHPHVYTLGKSGKVKHLLKGLNELQDIGAEFVEIDRGGDITYHGPGQIVGYPILDLDRYFTDIHKYLRCLEEVIICTLSEYGIKGKRIEKLTGVWVNGQKICAMGIRCSRWVTMHGFAFNVNTDLSYFDHIIPCGISNKSVISLSELLHQEVNTDEVKNKIIRHFSEIFDVDINRKLKAPGIIPVL